MLLVVFLIIGFLAKDALLKYLGPAQTVQRAGPKTGLEAAPVDASAPTTTGNAFDRTRGMQELLQKESEKRGAD